VIHCVKKLLTTAILPVCLLLAGGAADAATLNVHNLTSKPVALLFISPTWANNFRLVDEWLGDDYIMPGENAPVQFSGGNDCNFDLRAVFVDGTNVDHYGVDLCEADNWYLYN
jgi:hypothetical protein